jgi:hypothetical protein
MIENKCNIESQAARGFVYAPRLRPLAPLHTGLEPEMHGHCHSVVCHLTCNITMSHCPSVVVLQAMLISGMLLESPDVGNISPRVWWDRPHSYRCRCIQFCYFAAICFEKGVTCNVERFSAAVKRRSTNHGHLARKVE